MKRHPHAESEAAAAVRVAEHMVERRAKENVDVLELVRWRREEFESWCRDSRNASFAEVATLLMAAVDVLAAETGASPEATPYPRRRDPGSSIADGETSAQALLPSMVAEIQGTASGGDLENPAQILLGFVSRLLQCLLETGNLSEEELNEWWREILDLRALKNRPSGPTAGLG